MKPRALLPLVQRDRLVHTVDDVHGVRHPRTVIGHAHEQPVEIDVPLVVGADRVVQGVAGDGQHRLPVALGTVQAMEQDHAARAGGGHASAQLAAVPGVAGRSERGGFLVAHRDEAQLVLVRAQRLEQTVDAVAGAAGDGVNVPIKGGAR